ncbi:MAG: hypothetical protein HZA15_07095 [Nitrospirae bacterium]|nr:hypothetical protein [Nitrospirota bacterium]
MKRHNHNKKKFSSNEAPPEINNQYLQDLQNWTDNRYNPGFYTEGNIPPEMKYPKRPMGLLLIFFGLLTLVLAFGIKHNGPALFAWVVFIAGMLQLVAGLSVVFKIHKT